MCRGGSRGTQARGGRHPEKTDALKEGAEQSHIVARKRPLTLKKESSDGCCVVFSATRSSQ